MQKLKTWLGKMWNVVPGMLQKLISFTHVYWYIPVRVGPIKYFKFYNFIEKSQWWPRQKLEQYQLEKLTQLLRYAYTNVPYYKELFNRYKIKPEDIKAIRDLQKLPVLSKETFVDNFDKLVPCGIKKGRFKLAATSGSTGKPLQVYQPRAGFDYTDYAFFHRSHNWANVRLEDRKIFLRSRPFVEEGVEGTYMYNPLVNGLTLSALSVSQSTLKQYIELMKKFRPVFIIGNPSLLSQLSCYLQQYDIKDITIRSFISNFENPLPHQREQIKKQFKCSIYNQYTLIENVISAMECSRHEGLHVEMEKGILEVVDEKGMVLSDGQKGRLVATGLHGYIMPLIRYDTGDIGSIALHSCSCGRGLPLLGSFAGRIGEVIQYKDKIIYPATLSVISGRLTNIREIQFVQEKEDALTVNIIKGENYSEKDTRKIIATLKTMIDDELKININFVTNIPRTNMGKFPFIITKLKRHQ